MSCSGSLPVRSRGTFPPTLLLHGSRDRSTPLAVLEEFERLLEEKEVPHGKHVYRGMGHNFDASRFQDAGRRAAAFFDKHVKRADPRRDRRKPAAGKEGWPEPSEPGKPSSPP